jgi:dTDP-4-dehydrorhamnose reductase
MSATVVVLGHQGMLGHVVARYLGERGFRVATVAARFDAGREAEFVAEVATLGGVAAINCIGVRPTEVGLPSDLFRVNGLLPQLLAASLRGRLLVQPSTDAVFGGRGAPFAASARPDTEDAYGRSKLLGESALYLGHTVVLRTSLVGPERGQARSLLAWLSTQKGEVRGYTDQLWNGITTLNWAKLCERALEGKLEPGIHQPATEPALSKHELLETMCRVFDIDVTVTAVASGRPVDRRLVPTEAFPPIREQLEELRDWYGGASAR